ncbi:MAG: efflux RND transporter periplasmic adaptor subunit, partial [Planctomycetota bacterium]
MQVLFVVVVLAAGGGLAWLAIAMREEPPKRPPQRYVPVVPLITVHPAQERIDVLAQGEVVPRAESQLTAEISGRITEVAPQLVAGARVDADEVLVRIDCTDYRAALAEAEAALSERRRLLAEERARVERARREWGMVGEGEPGELVLRQPQLAAAESAMHAAEAAVHRAQRNVERCTIAAPYEARVVDKAVDLGQWVGPGARLAQLQSVDAVEVRVPLSHSDRRHLDLPLDGRPVETPVPVEVRALDGAGGPWQGSVVRTAARLDPRNRMLHAIVRVPHRREDDPLLVGRFVAVHIAGRSHPAVAGVPAGVVQRDDMVWVFTPGVPDAATEDEADAQRAPAAAAEETDKPSRPAQPHANGTIAPHPVRVLRREPGRVWISIDLP